MTRWLPFICYYAIIIMASVCLSVWAQTGFIHNSALIGSSHIGAMGQVSQIGGGRNIGLFSDAGVACELSGSLDEGGNFHQDLRPFHCRCFVRDSFWDHDPRTVDQWGRYDSESVGFDPYTGDAGTAFDKPNTPYGQQGISQLLTPCTDRRGIARMCWREANGEHPLLPMVNNCAAYGSKLATSMAYTSIVITEILSLLTYRSECCFIFARFSPSYMCALIFNITCLFIVLYVPPVTHLVGLAPLTPARFALSLFAPAIMLFLNEMNKLEYRRQLRIQHALDGVKLADIDSVGTP